MDLSDITEINPPEATAAPAPPPRKRRRPALSCEACRKRKIKCDRTYPCKQCEESRHSVCTYADSPPPRRHVSVPPAPTYLQHSAPCLGLPNHTRSPTSTTSEAPSNTFSEQRLPPSDGSHHSNWTSPKSLGEADEPTSQKALLKRVQDLEQTLATRHKTFSGEYVSRKDETFVFEQKDLKGTVSKTRFFGSSHWMYSFGVFDQISCLKVNPKTEKPEFVQSAITSNVNELLTQCKTISRKYKKDLRCEKWLSHSNPRDLVPGREICDSFVDLYFRAAESTLRILHIPSFRREYAQYWEQPAKSSDVFILKMLLAMAIGVSLYQGIDWTRWQQQAVHWTFAAQAYLATPNEKHRLHISGLQIQCLVYIARQEHAISGDLVWISTGALVRTAMQMGFHRDPKYLPKIPPLQAEMRRRLWATIMEMNIQSAIDSGMTPLISIDDFDTDPPSNLDDQDIDENTDVAPISKHPDIFTQTSLQIRLLSSLPARLEVVRQANSFRVDPTYESVLELSSSLTSAAKDNLLFASRINRTSPTPKITDLQLNLFDLSIRRFILSVHRPFIGKAQMDPRYYYSRKVGLDTAVTMLTYTSVPHPCPLKQDDFTRMKNVSGGFFKSLTVHATMVVFGEIVMQLGEDISFTPQASAAREPLKQILREQVKLAERRIRLVENNVKGHLFTTCILAQIEAQEEGIDAERSVMDAALKSLKLGLGWLKERYEGAQSEWKAEDNPCMMPPPPAPGVQNIGVDPAIDWNMDLNNPESWMYNLSWDESPSWPPWFGLAQ